MKSIQFRKNSLNHGMTADDVIGCLIFFLMMYPVFLSSLSRFFLPGPMGLVCTMAAVILGFMYYGRQPAIRGTWGFLSLMVLTGLTVVLNNRDLENREYSQALTYFCLIVLAMTLYRRSEWWRLFWLVTKWFAWMHLAFGIFFLINRDLQIRMIVPLFQLDKGLNALLISNIRKGFMTGLTEHYSTMAMYMALGLVNYAGVACSLGTGKTNNKWIMLVLFALGMILTGKRGPILFVFAALAMTYWVVNHPFTLKQYLYTILLILAAVIGFIVAFRTMPQIQSVVARFIESSGSGDITNGRVYLFWGHCLDLFRQKPLFGWGWRDFRYRTIVEYGHDRMNDAHDIYIQLLAETGVIGLLIFLVFFAASLFVAYRAVQMQKKHKLLNDEAYMSLQAALCFQLYFLMYGVTGNPLYDNRSYVPYFICCTIGYSAHYIQRKKLLMMSGGMKR